MWLMLQQDEPGDYVVASGKSHSVREFVELAFDQAGLDWRDHVVQDPAFLRPAEVDHLIGDASKARVEPGWAPEVSFPELVRMMVEADVAPLDAATPGAEDMRSPSRGAVRLAEMRA
jgi:GDPmannose 4,6-dehydratase